MAPLTAALAVLVVSGAPGAMPGREEAYTLVEALTTLDCIEDWLQLCAPPVAADGRYLGLHLAVFEDRVEMSPYMDSTLVYRVESKTPTLLRLRLESCDFDEECTGKGTEAQLRFGLNGRAVFTGIDPYMIFRGKAATSSLELVTTSIYRERHDALERRHVPGGACSGVTVFRPRGRRPCLQDLEDRAPPRAR